MLTRTLAVLLKATPRIVSSGARDLLVHGMRTGSLRSNRRQQDLGPAPIGFAITRYVVPAAAGASTKETRETKEH